MAEIVFVSNEIIGQNSKINIKTHIGNINAEG